MLDKSLEQRYRRAFARRGRMLVKSKTRDVRAKSYGKYQIEAEETVVAGLGYTLSLTDLDYHLQYDTLTLCETREQFNRYFDKYHPDDETKPVVELSEDETWTLAEQIEKDMLVDKKITEVNWITDNISDTIRSRIIFRESKVERYS